MKDEKVCHKLVSCLISFAYAISIPEALNIPDYEVTQEQTTTDALSWIASGGIARCNYAGYYGESRLSLTAFGPAKISFSWINQTGYSYDGYSFQVDGKTVGTQSHGDWAEFRYDLPAGAHYLTWEWRSSGHKYFSGMYVGLANLSIPDICGDQKLDPAEAAMRTYTTYGKPTLADPWIPLTDANRDECRFFKVSVEMK